MATNQQSIQKAKGRPLLQWFGKKPIERVEYFPAQAREVYGDKQASEFNKLFWGDNLQVLSHLLKDFRGKIDLIYIDPPFDSKADYVKKVKVRGEHIEGVKQGLLEEKQYTDIWANDEYLQFMFERLLIMRELLAETGTIFVHLDPTKSHYIKIVLDEIFGEENFRNDIIWRSTNSHNSATSQFGPIHQDILFYSKSSQFELHPGKRPFTAGYINERFKYSDENGIYQPNYLTGPGLRSGESGTPWNGFDPSSNGRHWAIPQVIKELLPEKGRGMGTLQLLDALLEQQLVLLPKKKNGQPMYKQYMTAGVQYQDLWAYQPNTKGVLYESEECIDEDVKWLEQEGELADYPTQKPEGLARRIIESCTSPDALVMDCFIGSGTTAIAAQQLGRRWIGCDINQVAIQTTTKRLNQTIQEQLKDKALAKGLFGFKVYAVNDYDIFKSEIEAKDIVMDIYGVESIKRSYFDGVLDNKYVKVMPLNRVCNKLDIQKLLETIESRSEDFKPRATSKVGDTVYEQGVLMICSGLETDIHDYLKKQNKTGVLVEVRDLQTHKKSLIFKERPEADIETVADKQKLKVLIRDFFSPILMRKLQLENEKRLKDDAKAKIEDFKQIIDSVAIDVDYDGKLFNAEIIDLPTKHEVIKAEYDWQYEKKGKQTVAVKIVDVLGEEYFETFSVEA